jgi:capsular polysaccharide biosynthesis protein
VSAQRVLVTRASGSFGDLERMEMQNEKQQNVSDEISLKDIIGFFKRNRYLIVFFGIAGLLFSTAYVILAPKKYEAHWQVQMAQFVSSSSSSSIGNIEEPALLIERLRTFAAYPVAVQQSCGIPGGRDVGDYLDRSLKIKQVKYLTTVVEMELRASSTLRASQCAEALVTMIVEQQRGLIEDRLAGRKEQLLQYQQALREETRQLEKLQKSELGSFAYLSRLDKLSWLRTRIDALQEEFFLSQKHPAKLFVPIFVSSQAVSPKVRLVLLLGISLGFLLGVLLAIVRAKWRREA